MADTPDHAAALAALDDEIAKDSDGMNCVILATDKAKALAALYRAGVELRASTHAYVEVATKNEQEWNHVEVHAARKREHAAHAAFDAALAAVADKLTQGGNDG